MAKIKYQCPPKVPPIGFFQPISIDASDQMSDVEFLLGILKKLNEVIKQVNSNSEFIDEYSGKIEEIEAEVAALRNEMTAFEAEINETLELKMNALRAELQLEISNRFVQLQAYVDTQVDRLDDRIDGVAVGQINLYDPTTGLITPIQQVINNIYDSGREDAITASEFDALELTATAFDAYEITAYVFDTQAKSILGA